MGAYSVLVKLARRGTAVGAALVAGLGFATVLAAHDFWIVPSAFEVGSDDWVEVRGQTGIRFPTSVSAVPPDRVADARVIGASSEERIAELSVSGKSLLLRHRPRAPGQRIVAVGLVTRTNREPAANLERYIGLEGAPELAERYASEGAFAKTDSVTRHTTKFAKTIVEVGRGGRRVFARTVGHSLELVPETDPAALRTGDTFVVRLLFRGRALAQAHLHAGAASEGETAAEAPASPARQTDLSLVTDAGGTVRIPLDKPGLWNVRTLHAAPAATGAVGEWEVAFATLVFRVADSSAGPSLGGEPSGANAAERATLKPSDSATAAATVERVRPFSAPTGSRR